VRFAVVTPQPDELRKTVSALQIDLPIARGDKPALQATIAGPKGELTATS
jgi:hypothetical protein